MEKVEDARRRSVTENEVHVVFSEACVIQSPFVGSRGSWRETDRRSCLPLI